MLRSFLLALSILSVAALAAPAAVTASESGDAAPSVLLSSNDGLRAQGMDYMIQQMDFYDRAGGRVSLRWFQKDFRWVPRDSRRRTQGNGISYLIDHPSDGDGADTPSLEALTQAIASAVDTWNHDPCTAGQSLRPIRHPGGDVTVFDFLVGAGGLGDPFAADVVVAGFPPGMAELFGSETLAFTVSYVFVDGRGEPTDVDNDGKMDTAHSEIYFNRDFAWSTDDVTPGFDLQSAALHEIGHALGLGHFGAPPRSVMAPVYTGILRDLQAIDHAALCVVRARDSRHSGH